jgi:RimJ/RimL family protein N-acetyltransferase
MLVEDIVATMECNEPEGVVTRNVWFMPLSMDNLKTLWEKSKQFDVLFTEEVRQSEQKFLELFLYEGPNGPETRGLFFVVDDFVGVFYMDHIVPGIDAHVHYSFFDRRQKGRVKLVKKMLRFAFESYGFRRLSVEIPLYATYNTRKFVEEIGFKVEGRKRKGTQYKGEWFDVLQYGILREEIVI